MLKVILPRVAAMTSQSDLNVKQRPELPRRHVLNRMMQEKSGRLYCNDDLDIEIPGLEIYDAR